jgi:UDP-glucose 4-epimerase
MKILLTGAEGMIAKAIRRVGAAEHRFGLMDVAESVVAAGGIRASVTDRDAVFRVAAGCDAILHTAAVTRASFGGRPTPAQYIEGNVLGTENVLAAAVEYGIGRVVLSSTMEILWGDSSHYGTRVLDESTPAWPESLYALTKLQAETLGSFFARRHGIDVVQLRYMAVQEKRPHEIGFSLLSKRMTAADVATANLLALTRPGLRDEVLCLGPDSPLAQGDIELALRDPWTVLERFWPGSGPLLRSRGLVPKAEDFVPVVRVTKAKQVLGWQPESRFENYLKHLGWTPTASDAPARRAE